MDKIELKDKIATIDAEGRELCNRANAVIEAEDLRGSSPATIRRVEEIVDDVKEGARPDGVPSPWEFGIMKPGVTGHPLVIVQRYLGTVGS